MRYGRTFIHKHTLNIYTLTLRLASLMKKAVIYAYWTKALIDICRENVSHMATLPSVAKHVIHADNLRKILICKYGGHGRLGTRLWGQHRACRLNIFLHGCFVHISGKFYYKP